MESNRSKRERAAAQEARRALNDALRQVHGTSGTSHAEPPTRAYDREWFRDVPVSSTQPARPPGPPRTHDVAGHRKAPTPHPSAAQRPAPRVPPPGARQHHQTWINPPHRKARPETADVSLMSLIRDNEGHNDWTYEEYRVWSRRYEDAHPVLHVLKRVIRKVMRYEE
jgi:hypothetical protein